MKAQSSDTPLEIEKLQIDLLRKLSVKERISKVRSISATVMSLSRRAIMRMHPEMSKQEIDYLYIEYNYSKDLANSLRVYLESRTK